MAEPRLTRAEVEAIAEYKQRTASEWHQVSKRLCRDLLAAMDEVAHLRARWCDDWLPEHLSGEQKEGSDA